MGAHDSLPLSGIRIIDFTHVIAGALATMVLGDFGAEIIKIEPRGTGEFLRGFGLWQGDRPGVNGSAQFNYYNRNKLGVTLDLGQPRGRDLARRLIALGDVIAENFAPGVMQKWGLDYPNVRAIKPDIVMISLSGFGQTGPWRERAAFGIALQDAGGLTYLTGYREGEPMGVGYTLSDEQAGPIGAAAILMGLDYRARTGRGLYIDLSELEMLCSFLGPALMEYTANGRNAEATGNSLPEVPAAPHDVYRCRGEDRWCAISVFTDPEWQALGRAMGSPAWTLEPRFATASARYQNRKALAELVESWTATQTAEEVMAKLQAAGIPAGVVENGQDLLERDRHLQEREFFVCPEHPVLGRRAMEGIPARLSKTPGRVGRGAPLLGQHNRYVFGELLGMTTQEVATLEAEGVI